MSDALGAKNDLEKSLEIKPDLVQSWVKIASVHMELGEYLTPCELALAEFLRL